MYEHCSLISLFYLSFITQAPSHILTFLSPLYFKKSYRLGLVFLLDSIKYLHGPVVMVRSQHGVITSEVSGYIGLLSAMWYGNAGRTSTITHDLKSIVTRLTNKAVSPWHNDSPTNIKNYLYHWCTI